MNNQDTTLPVYGYKDKILSIIESNSTTIIQRNTESRKSTKIPQYILDDHVKRSKPVNIVIHERDQSMDFLLILIRT
ncbi:unnamed protein product [Rotaria sp. Silwood2]|nr:unnamed protein product [Rotaria sp. Silwood2]